MIRRGAEQSFRTDPEPVSVRKETEMKIAMVHGQNHVGSTCHVGRILAEKLGGEVVRICFVMELAGLKGREKLSRYDVRSLITYEGK